LTYKSIEFTTLDKEKKLKCLENSYIGFIRNYLKINEIKYNIILLKIRSRKLLKSKSGIIEIINILLFSIQKEYHLS